MQNKKGRYASVGIPPTEGSPTHVGRAYFLLIEIFTAPAADAGATHSGAWYVCAVAVACAEPFCHVPSVRTIGCDHALGVVPQVTCDAAAACISFTCFPTFCVWCNSTASWNVSSREHVTVPVSNAQPLAASIFTLGSIVIVTLAGSTSNDPVSQYLSRQRKRGKGERLTWPFPGSGGVRSPTSAGFHAAFTVQPGTPAMFRESVRRGCAVA